MTDEGLWIERTLMGDREAFGQLALRYQERLYAMLYHVTGSREDAEDVTQEAFVQAFTKLASFRGHAGFYTWLYRIAFNVWASRRRRKRPVSLPADGRGPFLPMEPADRADGPLENVERTERVRLVQEALAGLDDDHRTVVVLRELDGCDYETISTILELPAGTVRSRLHRARLQLKRHLDRAFRETQ